jgi:hypothetical protein
MKIAQWRYRVALCMSRASSLFFHRREIDEPASPQEAFGVPAISTPGTMRSISGTNPCRFMRSTRPRATSRARFTRLHPTLQLTRMTNPHNGRFNPPSRAPTSTREYPQSRSKPEFSRKYAGRARRPRYGLPVRMGRRGLNGGAVCRRALCATGAASRLGQSIDEHRRSSMAVR